jgi:tRNA uridine 5-carboxymethylaminomethyl modification enzyme
MSTYAKKFDLIVVGAGHAGCEAGLASARMGLETLVLCMNLDTVAQMSCNPAIGGLAKGHLVREIDALGGQMGLAADATGIQFKMLNTKKGPAVQAPRAQCDKKQYQLHLKHLLEREPHLTLKQATVESLLVQKAGNTVYGVSTKTGVAYLGRAVILTTGTFLKGLIHIGDNRIPSGRAGEQAAQNLSQSLQDFGIELGRLKTGTNPRVDRRSVDLSRMTPQPGDENPRPFSYRTSRIDQEQILCWSVFTNQETHNTIRSSIIRSPLYNGTIKGVGPRYCPSIEDKVMRFPEKEAHQIFLEPEGRDTQELYLNGLSTSLPEPDQLTFLRTIPGFESCEIMRPGYAVEYDYALPTQLNASLESRQVENLFLAGQINGTSGYEEAAAQGLMAGINAALKLKGLEPFVLDRSQAYIGVLVDDLITKGTAEPYRLFTSLAEYRLLLRSDNADLRLMDKGFELGLIDADTYGKFKKKRQAIESESARLHAIQLNPGREINQKLKVLDSQDLLQPSTLAILLKRPELSYVQVSNLAESDREVPKEVWEQVEIQIKYDGYIQRQLRQIEQFKDLESKILSKDFDYASIASLSREAKEKLLKYRPVSIGQASRLQGISPADISVLLVALQASKSKQVIN